MAVNIKKDFGSTRNRKPEISTLVYGKVPPQAPELEERSPLVGKNALQN